MSAIQRPVGILSKHLTSPSKTPADMARFERIFDTAISRMLIDPERVKERVQTHSYCCDLFMHDGETVQAMTAYDKRPFKCMGIIGTIRIHFLYAGGDKKMQRALLAHTTAQAIDKKAQAIVLFVSNANRHLSETLSACNFSKYEEKPKDKIPHTVWVHQDLPILSALFSRPPQIEAPARAMPPPRAPRLTDYKSMTLMRKYLHMIRDGRKPVEGRINTGAFGRVQVGHKFRFFYKQNPNDDVYCTVTEVKTFDSFREMLSHFGYATCIPDARSLDDSVGIYQRIPGYAEKERRFGIMGMRLQVDPKPQAPDFDPKPVQRKRQFDDRYGPGEGNSHYPSGKQPAINGRNIHRY